MGLNVVRIPRTLRFKTSRHAIGGYWPKPAPPVALSYGHLLPDHFQCELDLPRRCRCQVNRARTTDRVPVLIEYLGVVEGCLEVGSVQDIEDLRSELHVEILGDPSDVVVFECREIPVHQPGPGDSVAARITHQVLTATR